MERPTSARVVTLPSGVLALGPATFHAVLFLALLVGLSPVDATAQVRESVLRDVTCEACRIQLDLVQRLGSAEGDGMLGVRADPVARDSRGRYYVYVGWGTGTSQISIFDSEGAFLGTLGRYGDGPGEHRGVGEFRVLPGDTVLVYTAGRRLTFSHEHRHLSTDRLPISGYWHPSRHVFFPGGRTVVARHGVSGGTVGQPLHLVRDDEEIVRSFGSTTGVFDSRFPSLMNRRVARAGPDMVWSAPDTRYRLERWTLGGELVEVIEREAPWFEPWDQWPAMAPDGEHPPPTQVARVRMDEAGRVWVMVLVPSEDWPGAFYRRSSDGAWDVDAALLWDTVIEVIDPRTPELLVSTRFSGVRYSPGGFLGEGEIYGLFEDGDGNPILGIWRLSITPP